MGEADRKELIARLSGWLFGGGEKDAYHDPKVAIMNRILERTDVSQEQAYRNAARISRELELVPDSKAKKSYYKRLTIL